ncbi:MULTISPECIES: hypothetical protein [unclassified Wolbachia]|uniref:hypothetical protein n=1 Tax=unclassified Wolbachia TaxID=2640676 RepID=UPI001BDCE9AB|nr:MULTISPECIES: hypothetical protein [unclassified Wolbachia]UXX40236.1 hypothetical protein MJ631_07080 [Wolbachia endosymbiont of Oryzaephilus surinamensis]
MNPRLKTFLVVCGYVLLVGAAIGAIFLFDYLLEIFIDALYAFLLAKTSSEVLAVFGTLAIFLAVGVSCYGLHKLCSIFTEKITSSYQSFKNENSDDNIFSEVYNDPTVGLKDKILFFSIYSIYYIQLPFLYCASKISELSRMLSESRALGLRICLVLINTILLIPVALLELIKYPLIKLFSPLGLSVKQMSFLFNVSDVGTGNQNVHTRSFEQSVIECAKKLKEEYGTPSNELDEEFKNYIGGLTNQQKELIAPYLKVDNYREGEWVRWVDSKTGLTLTQAINLVLIAATKQNADVELLKSILLVRFEESNRQCGPGMLNRIIYALSGLEAENNFAAQLEPQIIGELAGNATKKFLEQSVDRHYFKIKILKEKFDDLYSLDSGVDLSNANDEVKEGISHMKDAIKEFVFKELYVKFYNDYGEHIRRGQIKQRLRELITDEVIDAAISYKIDEIEVPAEPSTYLERVKAFLGDVARFSVA